jgi:hypothetical protein
MGAQRPRSCRDFQGDSPEEGGPSGAFFVAGIVSVRFFPRYLASADVQAKENRQKDGKVMMISEMWVSTDGNTLMVEFSDCRATRRRVHR